MAISEKLSICLGAKVGKEARELFIDKADECYLTVHNIPSFCGCSHIYKNPVLFVIHKENVFCTESSPCGSQDE